MARLFFFLMIRRPPRSTLDRSSAASDVYKRQIQVEGPDEPPELTEDGEMIEIDGETAVPPEEESLSLIHISEPTRPY